MTAQMATRLTLRSFKHKKKKTAKCLILLRDTYISKYLEIGSCHIVVSIGNTRHTISNSDVKAGGGVGECPPPDAFHWKTSADLPGKDRQGKKRKMEKKKRNIRNIVKWKVENLKWKGKQVYCEHLQRTFFVLFCFVLFCFVFVCFFFFVLFCFVFFFGHVVIETTEFFWVYQNGNFYR